MPSCWTLTNEPVARGPRPQRTTRAAFSRRQPTPAQARTPIACGARRDTVSRGHFYRSAGRLLASLTRVLSGVIVEIRRSLLALVGCCPAGGRLRVPTSPSRVASLTSSQRRAGRSC